MSKPLRILVVLGFPWDARLGAPQVWMELADEWRAQGHTVEKFSLFDAFPGGPTSGAQFLLNEIRFPAKAAEFVRANAHRFDVIDAHIGALPFRKADLGFRGLLVARSIGFYRFYEAFEREVAGRWPQKRPRGGIAGRLFYGFARRMLRRASEKSLVCADLINAPNEEEAAYLRKEYSSGKVLVQPYGLTDRRRAELRAVHAERKVRKSRVCFVGMWSARKGAYDWARIIDLVRRELPETQFTFLGTMVDRTVAMNDLGGVSNGIEFISSYERGELPSLLAPQTVGAFPSYVEGFGLGVLEQLAAGIPTVVYDAAGPREILGEPLRQLSVPAGDIQVFADRLVSILKLNAQEYGELSHRCLSRADDFRWPAIARATLDAYRTAIASRKADSIIFVQPFALNAAGGGARILRGLLGERPFALTVISSSPETPLANGAPDQLHLPFRPHFGRIEKTRFNLLPEKVTPLSRFGFRKGLRAACRERGATAIHAIPHARLDFYEAFSVARELKLPFFLQVHDDLLYSAKGRVNLERAGEALGEAWRGADLRFVISRQLGEEYCRRYGDAEFHIVTDGVTSIPSSPAPSKPISLRVYFMGLFHLAYEENLAVLLAALARIRTLKPELQISMTMRCGDLRTESIPGAATVRLLPFASEAEVQADLAHADLLYLPLPFGSRFEHFTKFSLSTKLVTYVSSGVPILYHGPADGPAYALLREHEAAVLQTDLLAESMVSGLLQLLDEPSWARTLAARALHLAREEFLLAKQQQKFWGAIAPFVNR